MTLRVSYLRNSRPAAPTNHHNAAMQCSWCQLLAVETGKLIKPGKVALVLAGCRRKAGILKNIDAGSSDPCSQAPMAGIDLHPRKVTAAMGTKKIIKRSKIKPFVKVSHCNPFMPT